MSDSRPTATVAQRLAANLSRITFLDNLRWCVIVLVIMVHAGVTYSGLGSWYYVEKPSPAGLSMVLFAFFQTHCQAFFMGLLFFVAGCFVPGSFDRKGPGKFLRDRWQRLGVPTLVYMLAIHPLTVFFLLQRPAGEPAASALPAYADYIRSGRVLSGTGPMWFALALFISCCVYAGVRVLFRRPLPTAPAPDKLPGDLHVLALIFIAALGSFVVRLVQPIGTSVLNMQLCFFPQYVLFFWIGIVAGRRDWLMRLPRELGFRWLKLACLVGPAAWLAIMALGGAANGDFSPYVGDWRWQSAAYAAWEAFFAVAFSLGLLAWFRAHAATQGPLARFMSDNAFAVYVWHPPILIGLSLLLRPLEAPALAKFLLVSALAVAACFLTTQFILAKIPLVRKIR